MTLTHYSHAPIEALDARRYVQDERNAYVKPVGLWVSVDGEYDWAWWCEAESFGIGPIPHRVTLRPGASVLTISTLEEFAAFRHEYEVPAYGSWSPSRAIDWPLVVSRYQGIIIAPYQWTHRLSVPWYYGWDCASGCIWDLAAIQEIRPIQQLAGTVNSDSPHSKDGERGAK